MPKKITNIEIAATIAPMQSRWPTDPVVHWERLHQAVQSIRDLVATVDASCLGIEADTDLSPEGLYRRRAEIGRKAIAELEALSSVRGAESAVQKAVETFDSGLSADIPKPTTVAEVALAQEIRQFMRSAGGSPFDFAMRNVTNPVVLGAIVHAPQFLSGLDDAAVTAIRARASTALHPDLVKQKADAEKALEELQKAVGAAKRLVFARTETVQEAQSGVVRGIRDKAPAPAPIAEAAE
ncbi:hypothetical protein GCM10010869_16520 [Mesorhizobium tianshanense]|uniref:Uncharacterized protein n=1 Tax=Mesorhizobium tianshanense TaxID=39844 RepID=A0A562NW09_9HYPH|nr:hypothetical protein [Mesorhizobium tianshanense]TWI36398.1 hypothetical protein IQ26_02911 [Mesorhizobium tianshanense]GLS36063.1 hypothetical protein GCM10010869_16520 [Mesorhizobium tianshanense]